MPTTRPTAIVTDSTSTLSEEPGDRGLKVVSLYVILNGDQLRETEIEDRPAFYERLRASDAPATTSQPSIGDFVDVYEPILAEGRDIVSIHISAGISGTCEAARQAAKRLELEGKGGERIHVVDSRTSAGGLGLLALSAENEAGRGASADRVVERVLEAREGLRIWFMVDTLEFLRKGGRIGGAQALLGGALKIKPILTLGEQITPVERVRTTRRAIQRLKEFAAEAAAGEPELAWATQHIESPEVVDELAADGERIFGYPPVFATEVLPVLGCHTGPGLIGIGVIPKADLE